MAHLKVRPITITVSVSPDGSNTAVSMVKPTSFTCVGFTHPKEGWVSTKRVVFSGDYDEFGNTQNLASFHTLLAKGWVSVARLG
jgi:hypothetical protein